VVRGPGAAVVEGRLALSWGDIARAAWSFEPSGAHDLGDRIQALRRAVRVVRG
jgi:hypothetical protein